MLLQVNLGFLFAPLVIVHIFAIHPLAFFKLNSKDPIPPFAMSKNLVVATRLHLGSAKEPPDKTKTERRIKGFAEFVSSLKVDAKAVIAVDPHPKFDGFDYVAAIQEACESQIADPTERPHILPVTPWGKFVPALNALVAYAAKDCQADLILFVSAETNATPDSIQILCQQVAPDDTLVAGALLGGHQYHSDTNTAVELDGRTTPWNTMAVWKLPKLALTGFQLVSEGLLTDDATEPSYGVEEAFAIAVLQKVLGVDQTKAKLVKLADVEWNQSFEDEERRQWHEKKMNSKIERAGRQLQLAGLSGKVYHC